MPDVEHERWRGSVESTLLTIDRNQTALALTMKEDRQESEESRRRIHKSMEELNSSISDTQTNVTLLNQQLEGHITSDDQKFGWIWTALKIVGWIALGGTAAGGGAKIIGILP